jgi:hypothetical protein
MEITQEEVFGPVDPIITVDGDKEANKIANILNLVLEPVLGRRIYTKQKDYLIWFKRT